MVEIDAEVIATDACGPASVILDSIVSNESDGAPGNSDGHTAGEIQQAVIGTADFMFDLRAERDGDGVGRECTVSYTATDGSGNQTTANAIVIVDHDKGNGPEPLSLTVEMDSAGARLQWTDTQFPNLSYSVIRGDLADFRVEVADILPGTVMCVEAKLARPCSQWSGGRRRD